MEEGEETQATMDMPSRRGPSELRYQIQGIYFLPPDTPFPAVKRDHEGVAQHMLNGYGFPSTQYNTGKFKKVSLPIKTSNSSFKAFLRGLYPRLTGDCTIHTVSKSKELVEIPPETNALSWLKSQGTRGYKGILVIKEVQTSPSLPASKTEMAEDPCPVKNVTRPPRKKQNPVHLLPRADPAGLLISVQANPNANPGMQFSVDTVQTPGTTDNSPWKPAWCSGKQQMSCYTLEVDQEVYDWWCVLGISEGLKGDAEVARYLIKLYESMKSGPQVSTSCAVCQTPLTLCCTKCPIAAFKSEREKRVDSQGGEPSLVVKVEARTESQWKAEVNNLQDQSAVILQLAESTDNQSLQVPLGVCSEHGDVDADCKPVSSTEQLNAPFIGEFHTQTVETEHDSSTAESVSHSSTTAHTSEESDVIGMPKKRGRKNQASGDKVCDLCGKSFRCASVLKEHRHLHTGEKPHVCKICDASFRTKHQLKQHEISKHTNERPYLCPICGRSYNLIGSLNLHIQRHKGKKSFVCNVCGAGFYANAHLIAHGRVHTDERPFLCTECGSAFREKSKLKLHMRTHTGEKPFKCTICPAAFGRKKNLVCHVRRHNSDKPFRCDVCNYTCVDASILKVHARTHTGEKPYVCQVCGTAYAYNVALRNHMKHHTDHEMYMCSECGEEFRLHVDMVRHKQSVHNTLSG